MEDVKVYKTPKQLIQVLEKKGLKFNDKKRAEKILTEINYFILSYYAFIIKDEEDSLYYKEGATFNELYLLYLFDKDIKMLFLRYIIDVENEFKNALNHLISTRYGYIDSIYLQKENYNQNNRFLKRALGNVKEQLRQYGRYNPAVQHYQEKYGYVPFWVLSKVITMGAIRGLYEVLKPEDQMRVAKHVYDQEMPHQPTEALEQMLALLVDIRNLAAHDEFVFDYSHKSACLPRLKEHDRFAIENDGRNDLLAVLISLKYVIEPRDYQKFLTKFNALIDNLVEDCNTIDRPGFLKVLKLPHNYMTLIN
jgi:abortive infection bacteriophage resistance protein